MPPVEVKLRPARAAALALPGGKVLIALSLSSVNLRSGHFRHRLLVKTSWDIAGTIERYLSSDIAA